MKCKKILSVLFLLCFAYFGHAEQTPVPNLYQYKLDNGLMLFVAENHAVPLAYIEIAVKCGAYTQTPETAGLFHLYEHMMFKGNSLYPNAAAVQDALSKLGVASWNGTTSLECVNYFFTIPSDKIEDGLNFWNSAIRFPLLDKRELENEKKVVISEIQGNEVNPQRILYAANSKQMFPEAPWKMDTSGSVKVISDTTVKQLKQIKNQFYIPNNAALFVGGDVNPEEVFKLVNKIFGSWKKGKDPFANGIFHQSEKPFTDVIYNVMPFDQISSELAQISVEYRGPDVAFNKEDTYVADLIFHCVSSPSSVYKQVLVQDPLLMIPDLDYTWGSYLTRKQCGTLDFGVILANTQNLPEKAMYLLENLPMLLNQTILAQRPQDIEQVCQRMKDSDIFDRETAERLLSIMRFWWICADADYYYSYSDNIKQVTQEQMLQFVEKYITQSVPIVTVLVNPAVYENTKSEFEAFNFSEITSKNAFWWKK